MQKRVLLLHGWGGSDNPHWQSWLASEIAKEYGTVSFLKFSNYDTPKLAIWMQELQEELIAFKPDVVICHSLANTLWFHLCNKGTISPIEKLYLVAPPSNNCSIDELSEFFPLQVPKNLFAKNAMLITSTDDPYMSEKEAKELQQKLQTPMKILENAGHINADSGYGEWLWIKEEINS